jgi:hypothetical protein
VAGAKLLQCCARQSSDDRTGSENLGLDQLYSGNDPPRASDMIPVRPVRTQRTGARSIWRMSERSPRGGRGGNPRALYHNVDCFVRQGYHCSCELGYRQEVETKVLSRACSIVGIEIFYDKAKRSLAAHPPIRCGLGWRP